MSGLIEETLRERADEPVFDGLDLDAVLTEGRRRVHRRRVATGVVVASVVAVATLVGVVLPLHSPAPDRPPVVDLGQQEVTYAVGRTLHVGDRTVDLGRRPVQFVRTARGIVFADARRTIYAYDGDRIQEVGVLAKVYDRLPRLVADESGRTVAWLEHSGGDDLDLAVLTVTSSRVGRSSVQVRGQRATVVTVAGRSVFLYDGRRLIQHDEETGFDGVIARGATPDQLQDVAAGRYLHEVLGRDGEVRGSAVDTRLEGRSGFVPTVGSGDLSPDGTHWFTEEADAFSVYDSDTGKRTDPPHPGFAFAAPYAWLDDDTMAVIALRKADDRSPISLLTCGLSSGCTVAAPDIGMIGNVTLPVGEPLD